MSGKVVVVTGANTGLGFESAAMMARAGARVVMACRSMERCERAKTEIIEAGSVRGELECWQLDLSSLASVSEFGRKFSATCVCKLSV